MALILIVNEQKDACRLFQRVLTANGHEVHSFTVLRDALQWLRERDPDAAILEFDFEKPEGRQLLERICDGNMHRRVLLITGSQIPNAARLSCHFDEVNIVMKPYEIDELEKRVDLILAQGGGKIDRPD